MKERGIDYIYRTYRWAIQFPFLYWSLCLRLDIDGGSPNTADFLVGAGIFRRPRPNRVLPLHKPETPPVPATQPSASPTWRGRGRGYIFMSDIYVHDGSSRADTHITNALAAAVVPPLWLCYAVVSQELQPRALYCTTTIQCLYSLHNRDDIVQLVGSAHRYYIHYFSRN